MILTLANLKTLPPFSQLVDTDYDDMLEAILTEVSADIRSICNQPIESAAIADYIFDGYDSRVITLPFTAPVTAIANVKNRSNIGEAWTTVTGVTIEKYGAAYRLVLQAGFTAGAQNYKADITVGYSTIPDAIVRVAREMVAVRCREHGILSKAGTLGIATTATADAAGNPVTTAYKDLRSVWAYDLKRYTVKTL